uniref:Uncharacterized protein n=1 Tax=Arundo donax TaxID=35708 RepID=A0A0A9DW50_ARUDO
MIIAGTNSCPVDTTCKRYDGRGRKKIKKIETSMNVYKFKQQLYCRTTVCKMPKMTTRLINKQCGEMPGLLGN